MDTLVFMDMSSIIHDFMYIHLDFYGYPSIDLLWILDQGVEGSDLSRGVEGHYVSFVSFCS